MTSSCTPWARRACGCGARGGEGATRGLALRHRGDAGVRASPPSLAVPCPRRSLLVLGGNSGNIAKHCISCCSGPRISITLRKQPPPDWRPSTNELVRGGKRRGGKINGGNESRQNASKDKREHNSKAKLGAGGEPEYRRNRRTKRHKLKQMKRIN